jgi:hypothetical protein
MKASQAKVLTLQRGRRFDKHYQSSPVEEKWIR